MSRPKKTRLPSDFSDLLAEFDAAQVEYLVVGGHAVGAHGRPRATKDLDLWVAGGENLDRVARALERFGLPAPFVAAARTLGSHPHTECAGVELDGVAAACGVAAARRRRDGARAGARKAATMASRSSRPCRSGDGSSAR
jgi:hypothetical protein